MMSASSIPRGISGWPIAPKSTASSFLIGSRAAASNRRPSRRYWAPDQSKDVRSVSKPKRASQASSTSNAASTTSGPIPSPPSTPSFTTRESVPKMRFGCYRSGDAVSRPRYRRYGAPYWGQVRRWEEVQDRVANIEAGTTEDLPETGGLFVFRRESSHGSATRAGETTGAAGDAVRGRAPG